MTRRRLSPVALIAVGCVLLVPLLIVVNSYLTRHVRAEITFHEQERIGIEYIRPVSLLLSDLVGHRLTADDGDATSAVAPAVAAVDAVDRRYGQTLATSGRWSAWKVQLEQAQRRPDGTIEDDAPLTSGLADLIVQVANESNLILDPELDSYYLMDVLVARQPVLLVALGQTVGVASTGGLSQSDRDLLVVARATIERTAAAIAADLATSFAHAGDPQVEAAIAPLSDVLATTVAATSANLTEVIAGARGSAPTAGTAATMLAMSAVDTACADQLDDILAGRIDHLRSTQKVITEVLVALAGLLVVLAAGLARALRTVGQKTDELRHQAMHDALTGLPNRALVLDRVEQALARARRGNRSVAVMFLDLDGFKGVNDTYGHAVGDQLLRGVSARLTSVLRATDTVGRLGGDEFVVLVEGASLATGPEAIADRVRAVLAEPFVLDGTQGAPLRAHASIGIAVGARTAAADLLRDADVALYEAKAAGKDRYVVFAPEMQLAVQERLELEMDLVRAVDTEQLFLLYQPTLDLRTEQITGFEALLRWNHPTRGLILPEVFIAVAEESGLIVPIGRSVLVAACTQAAAWQRQGRPYAMAVNVSGRQLGADGDLLADVRSTLEATGLDPASLTLELTETMLMRDADRSADQLADLKRLGLRLAIDDFGTGYSSLAYLQKFPVDVLKIDRLFVAGLATSAEARALVHTFVELGRTFGIETWAEGIEDREQLRCLQEEGCDSGQGYLFGRPMSAQDVAALITARTTSSGARRLTQAT